VSVLFRYREKLPIHKQVVIWLWISLRDREWPWTVLQFEYNSSSRCN